MIPTGGLSVIIHLAINGIAALGRLFGLRRRAMRGMHPILILSIVVVAILSGGTSLLAHALANENNLDHLAFMTIPCVAIEQKESSSGKHVILRIDDIQAYAWSDIQQKMINDALSYGYSPVLGVIPLNLRDDAAMYSYLRSVRCSVEFALHGWDNKEPVPGRGEFSELSEKEASEKLAKGVTEINRLARRDVITFIPPNNEMSPGALKAAENIEIEIISSQGYGKYDYDAETFDFVIDEFLPAQETMNRCDAAFDESDMCIIMLHPQDYASEGKLDPVKYAEYTALLDMLVAGGYGSLRFMDIDGKK
jgi:hypothetical protein